MMFGKMLLLAAAAALLPLSAAPVFELKFDGNKANWGTVVNYKNQAKIENKAFQGAKMAAVVVSVNPKKVIDTSFAFQTPAFDVTGKKVIKISGEIYSSRDLKYTGGAGERIAVVIPGPKNTKKLVPFAVSTPKAQFTKFTAEVKVTSAMKKVFVQVGYDNPNLIGADVLAVKALKVEVE